MLAGVRTSFEIWTHHGEAVIAWKASTDHGNEVERLAKFSLE